jgi:hypothetical protein
LEPYFAKTCKRHPKWRLCYATAFLVCFYTVCAMLCDHKGCICIKCKLKSNRDTTDAFIIKTHQKHINWNWVDLEPYFAKTRKCQSNHPKWGMQLRLLSISTWYVLRFVTISAVFALSAKLEYWHTWCIHHKNSSKIHQTILSPFRALFCNNMQLSPNMFQIDIWVMQLRFLSVSAPYGLRFVVIRPVFALSVKQSQILTHMMHSS